MVTDHLDFHIASLNLDHNIVLCQEIPIVKTNHEDNIINRIENLNIGNDENLLCNFDCKNLVNVQFKLKKSRTKVAQLLCRKYNRPIVRLIMDKDVLSKKIKVFHFNTPSPDDGIKCHLKK